MKKPLYILFSLFFLLMAAAGQETFLQWELSPNPVGVNENFTLSVVIPDSDPREVEILPVELPEGIQLFRGPLIRSHLYYDSRDGSLRNGTQLSWTFRAQAGGRYPFGGFNIAAGGEVFSTGPFLVEVGVHRNRQLVIPLEARWIVPEEPVYPGEAVPVILEVIREREIPLFDTLQVRPPASGLWDEQAGLGEIISREEGGSVLYSIPAASYLFTPTEDRAVVIPQAVLTQGERSGTARQGVISIIPLPDGMETTGAIGRFELSGFLEGEHFSQGDEVLFRLRLTGTGNLNYLKIPHPEFIGARVLSVQENQEYSATMEGYRGYRELSFILSLQDSGELRVQVPAFPVLDRSQGRVEILPAMDRWYPLAERKTEEAQDVREEFPFLPDEPGFFYKADFTKNRWLFLLFLPGPLFFVIARILRGRAGGKAALGGCLFLAVFLLGAGFEPGLGSGPDYRIAEELYREGAFAEALAVLESFDHEYSLRGFHLYDKSLVNFRMGNTPRSLVQIHGAVQLEPMNPLYRDALAVMEREAGIGSAYPPLLPLDRRILLFTLMILVNLFGLWGGLYNLKPGGGFVILLILTGTMILGNASALGCALGSAGTSRGIVFPRGIPAEAPDQAYLKRIPRETGQDWLPVRYGTMVKIKDKTGGYVLVENGEKIAGWLSQDEILLPEDWK